MRYYKKVQKGSQTYIHLVESIDGSKTKTTYLGNINNLKDDVLKEVNAYFSQKTMQRQYKSGDVTYEELYENDVHVENKLFGDLWLIYQVEKKIDIIGIVNEKIIKRKRTRRQTPGFYLFLAIANRLISPISKSKLGEWLSEYDLELIFGQDINCEQITSKLYDEIFDNIDAKQIEEIGNLILQKCNQFINSKDLSSECSFDTTNLYTYIATETKSELAKRGKNKQGRDNLRQIGLAYLIQHEKKMPIYFKAYPGNNHDSKLFHSIIEDMLVQAKKCGKERLIIIFDDGNNSEDSATIIDNYKNVNVDFIASYSTSNDRSLVSINIDKFKLVNCKHNMRIDEKIKLHPEKRESLESYKVSAYSLIKELWGKKRRIVIIYNPVNAKKQRIRFNKNKDKLKSWLNEAKKKIAAASPYYTTEKSVRNLYIKEARNCYLNPDIFELTFTNDKTGLHLNYIQQQTFIRDYEIKFGKSILVTGNLNFTTEQIVQLHFDHYIVEEGFRQTKDHSCCCVWPIFHRKDMMLRAHILFCVVALCLLRILEFILEENKISKQGKSVIKNMHKILSNKIIAVSPGFKQMCISKLSNITPEHEKIFSIFNYKIVNSKLIKE